MRAASSTAPELRFAAVALCAFAAFVLLGLYVSSRTPTRIDVEAIALRGEAVPLAAFFTALGRWYAILPIAVVAAGIALAVRAQPLAVVALLLAQALSQGAVSALKPLFHRTRPDQWLLVRETDLSFPSGHAATAIVFFLALALLCWRTPQISRPVAASLVALLGICAIGIPWSRLALGAHYATDVGGGLLLGIGWLCATIALCYRFGAIA